MRERIIRPPHDTNVLTCCCRLNRPMPPTTDRASITIGSAQYRTRYAERESRLAALCTDTFDLALVVPVCGESATFMDGYRAAAQAAGRLLVIAVINGREGAGDAVHAANAQCFLELRTLFSLRKLGANGWLGDDGKIFLLVVDRFIPGQRLPSRQGVGLARKIGADLALELVTAGRVRHTSFAMTDADTCLPEDYFGRVTRLGSASSAGIFPFWHETGGGDDVDRATALYEIRLRYLQRGLQWAGSPYAFHTVGSTMVVHGLSYAQVRGVPRRRAAEDFYLLGKLSKLRPLERLHGSPVRIRSRVSTRVPFGTGAETEKLTRGTTLTLYHPDCFASVREVASQLRRLSESPHFSSADALTPLGPSVQRFLESQGAVPAWQALAVQAPNPQTRLRRFHEWFDGFRTLKLMHHVRDHGAVSLPWQDAVGRAPFINDIDDDGSCLSEARTELLRLEQAQPRLVGPSLP